DGEVRAKELEDRDVGDRLTMGGTMAFVNRDAAGSSPSDEFQAQPALSDPWLSYDADDLALPFDHPVQSGLEGSHLGIAADKAREAASLGGLQSSENPARFLELENSYRPGDALHVVSAEIAQTKEAIDEVGRRFGDVDPPRLR